MQCSWSLLISEIRRERRNGHSLRHIQQQHPDSPIRRKNTSKSCSETWLQDDLLLNTLEASPTDKINTSDCIKTQANHCLLQYRLMRFFPAMVKRTKGQWEALKISCQLSDGSIITCWNVFLAFHTTEATLKAIESTSNKEEPMWNLLCWLDQSKRLCRRVDLVKSNLGQPLLLFRAPQLVGIFIYD